VSSLDRRPTSEVLDAVLAGRPEVREALESAWDAAWTVVDPVVLELCRLRIATLLDCEEERRARTPAAVASGLDEERIARLAQWMTSPLFDDRQRACLAFAEQFTLDVAALDNATVLAVREQLGEQGLVDFVNALLVVEQRQRLRLVWQQLFGEAAA